MAAERFDEIPEGVADRSAVTVSDTEKAAFVRAVHGRFDTLFTTTYDQGARSGIDALYRRAKNTQWDADLDIDWSVGGQIDRARDPRNPMNALYTPDGGVFRRLGAARRAELGHATAAWTISQFLHAEQGAVVCAAKLVQAAPWIDAKFYAASQVMDEARHTEVYARYLREKLEWQFPVNVHLQGLLDAIVGESRWDFTYLGMQVVIEGLALAAFGLEYRMTPDPLLKQITRYVMADEARHVAFGVLSLREVYADLTAAELRERQEFCFDSSLRMRDRFLAADVWDTLGLPVGECTEAALRSTAHVEFRHSLFARIVPNLKKLGLLDFGEGWLRRRFGEMGVLEFEFLEDTSSDYEQMDLDHAPWSVVQFQHY